MSNDSYEGLWRKSTHSGEGGNDCVEAAVTEWTTGVRDTKARHAGMLEFPARSWSDFLVTVRANELRS
jgi:hypothetical protein